MDSGATMHMCKDKGLFESISNDPPCSIRTAGKSVVMAYGRERVKLNVLSQNARKQVVLSDVLYTPDLRNNLMSVPAITSHGYSDTFGRSNAVISQGDGSTVLTAVKKDRMYVVRPAQQQNAMNADGSVAKLKT